MARPKIEIDEEQVKKLAAINCSLAEMAAVLGCSVDTLGRRFAEVIEEGRSSGKMSLKRKQYEVAMSGNVTMLIWLGKILLEQRDTTYDALKHYSKEAAEMPDDLMIKALRDRANAIEEKLKQQ